MSDNFCYKRDNFMGSNSEKFRSPIAIFRKNIVKVNQNYFVF